MQNAYKFDATISGQKQTVVFYDADDVLGSVVNVADLKTHHILLMDRSGSMYSSLGRLCDQVKETINSIKDEDIVSVIWYSGPGQYRPVVIGAKPSDDINKQIDDLRSTVGMTCFSESIKEAFTLLQEKSKLVDQTSLNLFTDGQPVVPWNDEEDRCRSLVQQMADAGLVAFNCIGYGYYYNREFMTSMSDITPFGTTIHNSSIDEFLDSFKSTVNVTGNLVKRSLEVNTQGTVIYLSTGSFSMHENGFKVNRMDANRNSVYIITDSNDISIHVNGDTTCAAHVKNKATQQDKDNFFYAYAASQYYRGKTLLALDIIVKNVKDRYLADLMINAFTADEKAIAQKALDAAAFDVAQRYKAGKCPPKYLPKADAFCIMDFFRILVQNPGEAFYVPFSKNVGKYERIGRAVVDRQNAFTDSTDEVLAPVNDLVWNKDELNLSVRFTIKGHVELNARAAKTNGLPQQYPAIRYNTHTFIKDGNKNISQSEFILSEKMIALLRSNGMKVQELGEAKIGLGNGGIFERVLVDFSKIPVINRMYIDNSDSLDDLHSKVVEMTELEAAIKVVNAELKSLYEQKPTMMKIGDFAKLNVSQIEVLNQHGISDKGVYGGIDNKKALATDSDEYKVRLIKFSLKGFSTLPSAKDFDAMVSGTKKVNPPGQMMLQYLNNLQDRTRDLKDAKLRDYLESEKETLKGNLEALRTNLNLVKMAKVLTNDFFHGLTPDDKQNYVYESNGQTMVLRTDYVSKYIDAAA